ncbi:MAG: hypothetical protein FJ291_18345 [Planctomycetes bacterium]|nr:hypothetical protein [Planctomycetota bacterium]
MRVEELKEVLHATPFRPFVLHLADGRDVFVKHPDFILISPTGRSAVVYLPDGALRIFDLLLVTEIEVKNSRRQPARS